MLLGRNAMTNLDSVLKSRDILLNLQLFMVFFRQTSQRQSAGSIYCKINVQCAIAQCAKKKSRDITADKGLYAQNSGFPSSHVWV